MRSSLLLATLPAVLAWGGASLLSAGVAWAQEATNEQAATSEEPAAAEDSAASDNAASDNAASDNAASDNAATKEAAGDEATSEDPSVVQEMAQGAEDAPVTVIEYGSFTCPHCAAWHAESYEPLKEDYIDTGEVRFVFREVYFDRPGLWASIIARCGGEMRFFGIHDMLYEEQREWIGEGEPAAIAENLRRIGRSAGLDEAALDTCLTDEARAEGLVAWFEGNMEADEIEGTPTFIINGEKHSNMAWDEMKAIIDAELAEAAQ